MIGLLEVSVTAAALLAALTWLLVLRLSPRGATARSMTPARRALTARLWLYAPVWVPALLVSAALAPGLIGALVQQADHCLTHGAAHHHHLCLLHPPHAANSALAWALPLALLLPAGLVFIRAARRARTEWRLSRALVATSRPSTLGSDIRLLDGPEPIALTVGWAHPTVLLSEGLVAGLAPDALAIVIAHERAHVARRDTTFALIDRLAASMLPQRTAAPLLEQLGLAREQACDAIAADAAEGTGTDGPLAVAAALTQVLRLGLRPQAVGVSVASAAVEARILHLLDPPRPDRRWLAAPLALVVLLVAAGTGPVHTALEHLITYLLH